MVHPNRFAGKVAVVTGAAQGIGREVALRIAREGGGVAMVDQSELVEEARREAEAAGAPAIAIIADLETFAGATTAMETTLSRFGRIDILINNVGGTIWAKPYAAYDPEQIEAEVRRSLFPTLWCCRAVLPAMLQAGGGAIINVSSVATRGINRVPYGGGKGRGERDNRLSGDGVCRTWHPCLWGRTRRYRGPATARPTKHRATGRTRGAVVSRDCRPNSLIQLDEAIRHNRRTGRGDIVPGLHGGLLHHRRHAARRGWRSWLTRRNPKSRRT